MAFNRPGGGRDDNVHIGVSVTANEQSINKTKRMLENFKKSLGDATGSERARELQKLAKEFAVLRENGLSAGHAALQLKSALEKIGATKQETAAVKAEYDRLTKAIAATKKEAEETARAAELAAQKAASSAAKAAASTSIPQRGEALQAFGREARLSLPSFPIPGTPISTDFLGRIAEVSGRLGLTFKELATLGGAAAFAIAGISLAIKTFQDRLRPVNDLLEGLVSGRAAAAGIATQGPQAIVDAADQLRADLDRQRAERDSLKADISTLRRELGVSEDPNALLPGQTGIQAIFAAFAESNSAVPNLVTKYEALNKAITENEASLDDLNKRYAEAQALVKIDDLQKEYNDQLQRSGAVIDQLKQQYNDLTAAFEEQTRQREEDQRLQDRFQAEDRQLQDTQRAENHQDNLAKIEEDGNQRVEDLRENSQDRLADLEARKNDRIEKINADLEKAIANQREDLQKDEDLKTRKFRQDQQKADDKYQEERKRRLEDQAQELLDAEASNDVEAFIRAQQQAEKENQRRDEDFQKAQQQRQEEFDTEAAERRQQRDDRIAELRAEAAERTQIARDEFEKEKAALIAKTDEQINEELARIDERKNAAIAAYNEETDALIAARERADQRAAILEGVQESRRQAAHQAELARLSEREQAENDLLTGYIIKLNTLRNQLYAINNPNASTTSAAPSINPLPGQKIRSFATGGIADRPTLALIGDRPGYREALIPFRQSEGIEAALSRLNIGKPGPTIHMDGMFAGAMIGGGVTQEDLDALEVHVYNATIAAAAKLTYGKGAA